MLDVVERDEAAGIMTVRKSDARETEALQHTHSLAPRFE